MNRKYTAHDENNEAREGDTVTIVETRPVSKTKSFALQSINEKARGVLELNDEVEA